MNEYNTHPSVRAECKIWIIQLNLHPTVKSYTKD